VTSDFVLGSLIVVLLAKSPILVKMAPNGPANLTVINFGVTMANFCTQNMIVTIVGSKANKGINIFFIATFFEFLVAWNAMVADESGIRR
jgi:hypothetical protein